MSAPKNSTEILALSKTAQAILAGYWGFGKGFTLTIQNQKSCISTECKVPMAELISAGIISDEKADDGYAESRTYKLTEKGSGMEFRKSMAWIKDNGIFSITESKAKP